jgi:DNA repair exonuclease SbcCD ATPase subunit
LTDQHIQELQQKDEQLRLQQEANNARIKQLQDEIAAKEAELNNTITDVGNNATQLQAQIEQLTREKQQKDAQIAQLQGDIAALRDENTDLYNRIVAATQAIAEATNRLGELNDPATFNEAELDAKFQELEESIQRISNVIQAGPPQPGPPQGGPPQAGPPQPGPQQRIPGNTRILYENVQFTFDSLSRQLETKAQQDPRPNNKYSQALQQLQGANDADDVVAILNANRIGTTRNGGIKGGKKTKKIRKQKGGYTYKVNSKRRSITTSPSLRSSATGRGVKQSKRR